MTTEKPTAKPAHKRAPRKPAAAKPATKPAEGSPWADRKPAKVLLDYVKAEVTDAADAPNRAKPFINANGQLHMHSSDWREWLTAHGMPMSKAEAAQPLRDAGLKVRAYPLPGEGRSLGFYIGEAPKGTEKLPRRQPARTARAPRPFGRLTDEQRVELVEALSARPAGETRDALLAQLTA